ncbi:NYN domain-containing protein [Dechloromonas sp. H13]|uniref:NYN domain-containing protein n=1 Tax=Dechloromonas sp. H13 TaxID=2570193 RepID=UPI0012912B38|nr:NYN domain-containing protein [Dechloromonas sp. H13]
MAAPADTASMALFCDFENIALGVRDAQYEKFDIKPVLERLLAKGSIVVKKAYCDWERYKGFKAAMHEANFELIEIPHVRQSGKNSADIRMVVDALDLCYTKAHVDTFVIISGDSDFSPLVSKLRENAKRVIGVGVKQSCSDLLVTNCDEFIYYDDLVREREAQRGNLRRERDNGRRSPEEEAARRAKAEERKTKAIELAAATFADMIADRGENERIWASVLKEVIKRRNPGFNETYFGFRSFGNLLEEAANRGLLGFGRDEKSGAYVMRAAPQAVAPAEEAPVEIVAEPVAVDLPETAKTDASGSEPEAPGSARRRGGRRARSGKERGAVEAAPTVAADAPVAAAGEGVGIEAAIAPAPAEAPESAESAAGTTATPEKPRRAARRPRQKAGAAVVAVAAEAPTVSTPPAGEAAVGEEKPARARRAPRARKPKAGEGAGG